MKPHFIYRGYELHVYDTYVYVIDWHDYCVEQGESGKYGSLTEAMDAIDEHMERYSEL